jgi:hypothetical protein
MRTPLWLELLDAEVAKKRRHDDGGELTPVGGSEEE